MMATSSQGDSRTLLVGAGSGRDMAKALLVREQLRPVLGRIDLGGVLTPWAVHTFDGRIEGTLNRLGTSAEKFLPSTPTSPVSGFFEPEMIRYNQSLGLDIDEFFLFSLQNGSSALASELERLIRERGYDRVIAVDVGGDILGGERDFRTVLTPIVDMTVLDSLAKVDSRAEVNVAVVSPGICGEIGAHRMEKLIQDARSIGAVTGEWEFDSESPAFRKLLNLEARIEADTRSRSNTSDALVEMAAWNEDTVFHTSHIRHYAVGKRRWACPFPVEVSPNLGRKVIFFDLPKVAQTRERETVDYVSVIEAYAVFRTSGVCGTELDCSLVSVNWPSLSRDDLVYLLTPAGHVAPSVRAQIIRHGANLVASGDLGSALVSAADVATLVTPLRANKLEVTPAWTLLVAETKRAPSWMDRFSEFFSSSEDRLAARGHSSSPVPAAGR